MMETPERSEKKTPDKGETLTLTGKQPTDEQQVMIQKAADYWREVANEAPVQALTRLEEAAKQIISLNAALQGLYFAVFAFSDLRKQVSILAMPIQRDALLVIFFIPVAFWMISLYCATQVFVPQVRGNVHPDEVGVGVWIEIRRTYEQTMTDKLSWLHWSHKWLLISFGSVLLVVLLLSFLLPQK
jgi:hypothetical protein